MAFGVSIIVGEQALANVQVVARLAVAYVLPASPLSAFSLTHCLATVDMLQQQFLQSNQYSMLNVLQRGKGEPGVHPIKETTTLPCVKDHKTNKYTQGVGWVGRSRLCKPQYITIRTYHLQGGYEAKCGRILYSVQYWPIYIPGKTWYVAKQHNMGKH